MDARSTIAALAAGVALGGDPTRVAPGAWADALMAFRTAHRALNEASGDELDAISDRFADIASAMITTPAPDRPALLFKLEHLFGDDPTAGYCAEWMEAVMADAHRLLSVGRA